VTPLDAVTLSLALLAVFIAVFLKRPVIGSFPCSQAGKSVKHYALTNAALDRIFKIKTKYGKFKVTINKAGYEYLTADPVSSYYSEEYHHQVDVYPTGFAVGIR